MTIHMGIIYFILLNLIFILNICFAQIMDDDRQTDVTNIGVFTFLADKVAVIFDANSSRVLKGIEGSYEGNYVFVFY